MLFNAQAFADPTIDPKPKASPEAQLFNSVLMRWIDDEIMEQAHFEDREGVEIICNWLGYHYPTFIKRAEKYIKLQQRNIKIGRKSREYFK